MQCKPTRCSVYCPTRTPDSAFTAEGMIVLVNVHYWASPIGPFMVDEWLKLVGSRDKLAGTVSLDDFLLEEGFDVLAAYRSIDDKRCGMPSWR